MMNSLDSATRSYWETFSGMASFPEERREELFKAFVRGRRDAINGTANSAAKNTWSEPDGHPKRSQSLTLPERITETEPIRLKASKRDFGNVITTLGHAWGHVVSADRVDAMSDLLMKGSWTVAELQLAEALIATDAVLSKQIAYERTISFGVFAQAKDRVEVKRGRLHTYAYALEFSQEQGKPLGELFEAVTLDESGEKRWRMK